MKYTIQINKKKAKVWIPSIYGRGAQWKYEVYDAWVSWVPKEIKHALKFIREDILALIKG